MSRLGFRFRRLIAQFTSALPSKNRKGRRSALAHVTLALAMLSVSLTPLPVVERIGCQRHGVKRLKIHYIRQSSRKATACIRSRYHQIAIFSWQNTHSLSSSAWYCFLEGDFSLHL